MKILDKSSGKLEEWSAQDIVDYVNSDRNSEWIDYTADEWLDAWNEWAEGEFYELIND